MLRKLVNQTEVLITLWPEEPLLIASGVPNAVGIDMPFVRTWRKGGNGEPYLPGSSLKGVLRSHAERISRTLAPRAGVCDPHFHPRDHKAEGARRPFCGDQFQQERGQEKRVVPSGEIYRESCPICRTFGSTAYRGRFGIGDAYVHGEAATLERRDGVGLDRFTGGAAKGVKFELEALTKGHFQTRIRMENFEDWQFGLLILLCRDLQDGYLSVGHGTTRGMGRLGAKIEKLEVTYFAPRDRGIRDDAVHGVGAFLGAEGQDYGYHKDDQIHLNRPVALEDRIVRRIQNFGQPAAKDTLFDDAIGRWAHRMEHWGAKGDAR